ncbi:hypothetical protein [Flagellimonas sp.]|uniref:hypothetical protein n=1 Tax=Flagellimonas sp. TaxID=2058762 RepID=UPI003F4A8452
MKVNKEVNRAIGIEVLSVDEEKRSIDFVLSSEAVDSYKTVFKSDKWRMARYNANPVVTFNHDDYSSDPDSVIGTAEIRFEGGKMIARAFFEDNEPDGDRNEKADKIYRKAKKGTLRGASIRAAIYEARYGDKNKGEDEEVLYFEDQELIAWSIVTIPSNPEALSRSNQAMEAIRSAIQDNDGTQTDEEKGTLSGYEAQYMYNKNLIEK